MEWYSWKIRDEALITQMKIAKPEQKFMSPTFRLFNFTFELELYPNGQSETPGDVEIYLNVCGLSPKVNSLHVRREYLYVELSKTDDGVDTITRETMYCGSWPTGHVKTSDIQKLNEMTFKVGITLYNVFDKDGEDITNNYLNNVERKTDAVVVDDQQLNLAKYTWKIRDKTLIARLKTATVDQIFRTPCFRIFNFPFELELKPNGQTDDSGNVYIFLYIRGLSPKVHSINMKTKYMLVEMDASYEGNYTVTPEKMYCSAWPKGRVKTADIQKLNQLTFEVDITLYNVFDKDGEDITDKYLKNVQHKTKAFVSTEDNQLNSNSAKLDSVILQIEKLNQTVKGMQQKISDLNLRMEEEEKDTHDDRIDKLEKSVKIIERTVNKLSLNSNINPEQQKLKSWFENKVKLPEYYDLFIENGIEDLSIVSLLTVDSIKGIGIDKIGHQIKLLHQIGALKGIGDKNNNNVASEGGPTAYI